MKFFVFPPMHLRRKCRANIVIVACTWLIGFWTATSPARAWADEKFSLRESPIDYFGAETHDAVGDLARRLDAGDVNLKHDESTGYLLSLLKALHVPVESQVLVFSRSSVNARLIGPKNPRALYFNDEIAVGYVPGAAFLEISAVDPRKGAMFYTLPQAAEPQPRLAREETCLLCHASSNSLYVPGHVLRSFLTDDAGNPTHGFSRVTHDMPLAQRWGGWYVTGRHGVQPHLGNLTREADRERHEQDPTHGGNATDLTHRFAAAKYPSAQSDIVALMVLDHQEHLLNLLTRVQYEHLFKREANSEEELLQYLLFAGAAPLAGPVEGTSGYAAWFEKQGPIDSKNRSLRQFDLKTRLFRHRCSYLIYSPAFDGLAAPVRGRLYRRLWDVLSGKDQKPPFAAIPSAERQAILEILRETKRGLPEYWQRGP